MHGEVDVQLSLFGLLLLTQPLNSSEQHTRADLEFSSDFESGGPLFKSQYQMTCNLSTCHIPSVPLICNANSECEY